MRELIAAKTTARISKVTSGRYWSIQVDLPDQTAARLRAISLSRRCSVQHVIANSDANTNVKRNDGKRRFPTSRIMITLTTGWVSSNFGAGGAPPGGVSCGTTACTWTMAKCSGCEMWNVVSIRLNPRWYHVGSDGSGYASCLPPVSKASTTLYLVESSKI